VYWLSLSVRLMLEGWIGGSSLCDVWRLLRAAERACTAAHAYHQGQSPAEPGRLAAAVDAWARVTP
jgi:hypothetical protein